MSTTSKKIVLISSDGDTFGVEESVVLQAQTIKHKIEDGGADTRFLLPNITGVTLSKVLEYLNKHAKAGEEQSSQDEKETDLKSFDDDFVKVDRSTLFDLILAAYYLDIKGLLDLCCQTVDDKIKAITPEIIPATFSIKNTFTPEEEADVRRENA